MRTRRSILAGGGEAGYAMLLAIFLVASLLLFAAVAAPNVLTEGRRLREQEAIWRGNQYVRAIRLYYQKNGKYPSSLEDLTKPNAAGVHFLRKAYKEPMNKADGSWRLIYVTGSGQLVGSVHYHTLQEMAVAAAFAGQLPGGAAGFASQLFGRDQSKSSRQARSPAPPANRARRPASKALPSRTRFPARRRRVPASLARIRPMAKTRPTVHKTRYSAPRSPSRSRPWIRPSLAARSSAWPASPGVAKRSRRNFGEVANKARRKRERRRGGIDPAAAGDDWIRGIDLCRTKQYCVRQREECGGKFCKGVAGQRDGGGCVRA